MNMQEAQKHQTAARLPNPLELPPEVLQMKASLRSPVPIKTADAPAPRTAPELPSTPRAAATPTTLERLKLPLLAIVAAGSMLVAGLSYAALEEARTQLASMSDAKASTDRALADAQSRLSAAEKAVADVKAALTMPPSAAAPKKPTP
jgi:hypothetical protein